MGLDEETVALDLNNPVFQRNLFGLQKDVRHQAIDTLRKIAGMRWDQVYADKGLHWEKISSVTPPKGISAIYSFRLNQSRRATAFRDGKVMRLLTIAPDHDATYGKK
jgi:hypothetical protein